MNTVLEQKTGFSRNNLDFLRLVFALIVFFFHLYPLSGVEAFSSLHRYLSGSYAVKSFFVISGMLIYRSNMTSLSFQSYLEKRVRRIYPAYFTVIVFGAFALSILSTLPVSRYFGLGLWKYIALNLLFLKPSGTLPGVFTSNNITAVNGVLWTLRVEVLFYLSVPMISLLCRRFGTIAVLGTLFGLSLFWKYGIQWQSISHGSNNIYVDLQQELPGQMIYFIVGIALLLNFDRLRLHFPTVLCISACLFLLDHFFLKGVLDVLWISGVVFFFGFWRYLGNFSKYGDFSYGIYIVHFPLIQTLVYLGFAKRSPLLFVLATLFTTLIAAFLLWHLVEKRFLAKSSHYRVASTLAAGR